MAIRYPRGVVVGVDGALGGRAALSFAIREAARRGSPVEVVTAWSLADEDSADSCSEASVEERPERARQRAQQVQDDAVAVTLQLFSERPVLSRQVVEGDAAQVLLRVARDADFLVVGGSVSDSSRSASLGSVSDFCVRHAGCAVVVVPPVSSTHTRPLSRRSRR